MLAEIYKFLVDERGMQTGEYMILGTVMGAGTIGAVKAVRDGSVEKEVDDMIAPLLALSLCGDIIDADPGGQWAICYTITNEGPVVTYEGRAVLHGSSYPIPCMEYSFEIPSGDLYGYCYRFDPIRQEQVQFAAVPFDSYTQTSNALAGLWCSPAVLEPWQSTPLNFKFSIRKTRFNADDLSEMLAAWGTASVWDLDGSGTVDGADIAIMLGNWEKPT